MELPCLLAANMARIYFIITDRLLDVRTQASKQASAIMKRSTKHETQSTLLQATSTIPRQTKTLFICKISHLILLRQGGLCTKASSKKRKTTDMNRRKIIKKKIKKQTPSNIESRKIINIYLIFFFFYLYSSIKIINLIREISSLICHVYLYEKKIKYIL